MRIKFSNHAKDRIKERGIPASLVIKIVRDIKTFTESFRNRRVFRAKIGRKILEIVAVKEKSVYTIVTAYYLEGKNNESKIRQKS